MNEDIVQLQAIRAQTLDLITQITAAPKPRYNVDGQTVAWDDYLDRLRATVDWCDRKLRDAEPFEITTRATT